MANDKKEEEYKVYKFLTMTALDYVYLLPALEEEQKKGTTLVITIVGLPPNPPKYPPA